MDTRKDLLIALAISLAFTAATFFVGQTEKTEAEPLPVLAIAFVFIFFAIFIPLFIILFLIRLARGEMSGKEGAKNGGLGRLFSFGGGGYERLVAWIEKRYGRVDPTWSLGRAESFMSDVLSRERKSAKDEKKLAGLAKYVELKKYRGLIKDGH